MLKWSSLFCRTFACPGLFVWAAMLIGCLFFSLLPGTPSLVPGKQQLRQTAPVLALVVDCWQSILGCTTFWEVLREVGLCMGMFEHTVALTLTRLRR